MTEGDVGPFFADPGGAGQSVAVQKADDEVEELGDLENARHCCSTDGCEARVAHRKGGRENKG